MAFSIAPRSIVSSSRGGILLDAFLIAVMVSAGAWAWFAWSRGARPAALGDLFSRVAGGAPGRDVSGRSARLHGQVRELLARQGIKDSAVVKAYTQERREGGALWLEDTLEVDPPSGFRPPEFMSRLAPLLRSEGLSVMRDKTDPGRWVLELGDKERVYERLIFRGEFQEISRHFSADDADEIHPRASSMLSASPADKKG